MSDAAEQYFLDKDLKNVVVDHPARGTMCLWCLTREGYHPKNTLAISEVAHADAECPCGQMQP